MGGGTIALLPNEAQSNYYASYIRAKRRFSNGFSLLSSFTYSKAITDAPQFRNAGGATAQYDDVRLTGEVRRRYVRSRSRLGPEPVAQAGQ